MVSSLATKHERPKMRNSFTKTDAKNLLAVANNAGQGHFNFYWVKYLLFLTISKQ